MIGNQTEAIAELKYNAVEKEMLEQVSIRAREMHRHTQQRNKGSKICH